jgi:diguanylate cyclase (GGDEF)-like protein
MSLMQGEHTIAMRPFFTLLLRAIFLVYFTYAIIFLIFGPYQLAILSIINLFLALINLRLFHTHRAVLCFVLTDIEVLSFSLLSVIFLKQDYGFSLYALTLIPLAYFISSTFKKNGRYILNPTPFAVSSCLVFLLCKTLETFQPFGYLKKAPYLSIPFYYINSIFTIVIIIEICKVFSKESTKKQTALENENTQLDFYANQDSLTKLQNRRYFEAKLEKSIEEAKKGCYQFSMLMCDIDDFKKINDTFGHIWGDKVLKNISDIILSNIRDFDCAARWGGEEFIILIKGGIPIASLMAKRINKAVANSIVTTENGDIHYTITIGISEYSSGISCNKLIDEADANLYIGKRSGKNCVIC